ncbi:hypothetical protein C7974DRAFT_453882 [Boeremia exigua]|uniref:uncharacterized protein n=1 Tax=Boeremia exigua TaxID=749465 RepID=UPI001E8EF137|nr:uncharacterized protein C7974DRAFT_453882 [Boeremia exigua]KAH6629254.1 hypothetical protein C7974DRAFT_453882 [Boeremia exigua]
MREAVVQGCVETACGRERHNFSLARKPVTSGPIQRVASPAYKHLLSNTYSGAERCIDEHNLKKWTESKMGNVTALPFLSLQELMDTVFLISAIHCLFITIFYTALVLFILLENEVLTSGQYDLHNSNLSARTIAVGWISITPVAEMMSRKVGDGDREVRIFHALCPERCLSQHIPSLSPELTEEPQTASRKYQNTGVQTLPPPNGDIFKLVHGRAPSESDYVRNVGTAAIGRFTEDLCSNPYELVYGTTYNAPLAAQRSIYTDTGFQTASRGVTTMALSRAKARASVMVNRHREAAIQAGYIICAESQDEMIIHSEQHPTAVRIDANGNLLEGTIEEFYLPNIHGTPLQTHRLAPNDRLSLIGRKVSLVAEGDSQVAMTGSTSHSSIAKVPRVEVTARISAHAPSSTNQTSGLTPVIDDEYGNVGSCAHEYVVYDAGATTSLPLQKPSSGKLKHTDTPTKKARRSKATTPKRSFAFDPSLPESSSQHENTLHTVSSPRPKDVLLSTQDFPSQPCKAGSEHTLPASQSTSTDYWELGMVQPAYGYRSSADTSCHDASVAHDISYKNETPPEEDDLQSASHRACEHDIKTAQSKAPVVARRRMIPSATQTVDDKEAKRKRSRSQTRVHDRDSVPEAKKVKISPDAQSKRKGVTKSECGTGNGAASQRQTTTPDEDTQQLPSQITPDNFTAVNRIKNKPKTRSLRTPRCSFEPYVPPAMRANRK